MENNKKAFDLDNYKSLSSEEGEFMQLHDPRTDEVVTNTEGKPVRIRLVGVDSPRFRNKQQEYMNRRLNRNKLKIGTAEQLESERIELLVACTIGWEGMIRNGQDWPFSAENARLLYSEPSLKWIRDAVDEFVGERSNFLSK